MAPPAFDLLHPEVRRVVYHLGWQELRPVQVASIQTYLESRDDIIIIAPTAEGKTEAIFLPVFGDLLLERKPSVQVLYVSPLKALINDQFLRLNSLAKELG